MKALSFNEVEVCMCVCICMGSNEKRRKEERQDRHSLIYTHIHSHTFKLFKKVSASWTFFWIFYSWSPFIPTVWTLNFWQLHHHHHDKKLLKSPYLSYM